MFLRLADLVPIRFRGAGKTDGVKTFQMEKKELKSNQTVKLMVKKVAIFLD
jgi:hypothetical protein